MDWHRLFGLILTDHFSNSPFVGELEKDLSIQQQYLDVVIVRKIAGAMPFRLPDGFDDLADHNLISFKSHHEAFDVWAMKELMAHHVIYRKLVSPSLNDLMPEDRIRLWCLRPFSDATAKLFDGTASGRMGLPLGVRHGPCSGVARFAARGA